MKKQLFTFLATVLFVFAISSCASEDVQDIHLEDQQMDTGGGSGGGDIEPKKA